MSEILYEIEKRGAQWSVIKNGEPGADYVTAEAALEVAVVDASVEMRSDNEIVIRIRPQHKD